MPVFVRFWGVRGSTPTPGPRTRRYGGNTSCVEIRNDDTVIVCDAGTGLRELGLSLLRRVKPAEPLTVHLFLSHPHWDHIQGFPFFGPAYVENTTIYVYCAEGDEANYRLLSGQMRSEYFPVAFYEMGAHIVPRYFKGDTVTAGSFKVTSFPQKHPGGSLGFRFEHGDCSVVYATDSELDQMLDDPSLPVKKPAARRPLPTALVKAINECDLLISDAQYLDDEYAEKEGWGHPRASTVVDLAGQSGAKMLALTHHDPMHSDRDTDAKVLACAQRAEHLGYGMQVFGAREGVVLRFEA